MIIKKCFAFWYLVISKLVKEKITYMGCIETRIQYILLNAFC
jgi:hypothetical protein